MRRITFVVVASVLPFIIMGGCKKQQQQPVQPQPTAYPTVQPTAYPTAQPTAYPTAQPTTTPTATGATGLSNPGPLAPPCQSDAMCLTAKCHPQLQKCIVPCTSNNDCIAPNTCMVGTGLCAPSMGGFGTPAPQ